MIDNKLLFRELFPLTTSSYVARAGSARDKYVKQPMNCGPPSLFPPFPSSIPCLSIPLYQPCASSNYMYIVIDSRVLNNFPFVRDLDFIDPYMVYILKP